MSLTPEQIAERRRGIGGSDARIVAAGTDEERYQLWQIKRGLIEAPQILKPWDAALRHHCESLILDWYQTTTKRPVTRRGELVISPDYPMLRANLDGVDEQRPAVIDAKMLNLFTPDAFNWAREHYSWQIVHQIIVTNIPNGALHVSVGMKEPQAVEIEYDEFQAMEYVDRCKEFWSFVESGKQPPGAPPPLPTPIPIEKMRVIDMTGNNEWSYAAMDWLGNEEHARIFEKATKGLKALVEKDVREASGHGIVAKRDGRGVSIKRSGE